jgi:hypothetical protein
MKRLAVLLIAISSLLTGCVVYDGPNRNRGDYDGQPGRSDRDRDHDGVRDSRDSRPNNPNRY